MTQRELLSRSLDAGRDVTNRTQDVLAALLTEISRTAQQQADQAQQLAQDLADRSKSNTDRMLELVDREIRAQVANLGLATKADIRRLEEKISRLEAQGKRAGATSTKKATTKKATTKKASTKRATTKKATTEKATTEATASGSTATKAAATKKVTS